jgi:hypothetical protein
MPDRPPPAPATAETRRDWEPFQVDESESTTARLKVRNGWLYRTIVHEGEGAPVAVAMVFVPGE